MIMARQADDPSIRRLFASSRGGPTVLRMLLGAQLRRLREDRNITRESAAYAIRASASKMSRLELGRVGIKERDVADLLTLYGLTEGPERAGLMSLVRQAAAPHWSDEYGDILPSWQEMYVALEEAAARLRTFEVQFVPSLLRTEEYTRAVTRLRHPRASTDDLERRVALEVARRRLLTRPDAPKLWAVIDESALRRQLGGREVMHDQLVHLLELSALPSVTLQIAPFERGLGAPGGPFTIMRFAEPDLPDVVYLEQLDSAQYLDKRQEIDLYSRTMDTLCAQAAPPDRTPQFLRELIRRADSE
ncbi:helix-turn-helix domain-containing protein [Thermomonospora umbrina]|uniref:Helix-turn-helix protein n=1 Tax=Thermomonospora umbrina TaxID=111806 RepID=A0A3D9STG2_9ACTN|nr:helix-turn-helix transcriptional regulator [Thermomonospora umbrina]REE97293.1 helix-turn-helix protein [Thermomonospora umbrina]